MRQKVAPAIAKIAVFDRVTRNSANDRNSDLPSFFELEERRYNDEMTSQSEREKERKNSKKDFTWTANTQPAIERARIERMRKQWRVIVDLTSIGGGNVVPSVVKVAMRVRECFFGKNRVPCTGSSRVSSKYIGCKRVECTDRGVKRSWRTHAPNRRTRRRNPLSVTRDPSRLLSSSRAIVVRRRVVAAHRIDFPPPTHRFRTFRKRVSACEKLAYVVVASRRHLSGKVFHLCAYFSAWLCYREKQIFVTYRASLRAASCVNLQIYDLPFSCSPSLCRPLTASLVSQLFVTRAAEISKLDVRRGHRVGEAAEEEIATINAY